MKESTIEKVCNKLQFVILVLLAREQTEQVRKAIEKVEESRELLIQLENVKNN